MTSCPKTPPLALGFLLIVPLTLYSQSNVDPNQHDNEHSTIILFRTFDIFSFDRSYKVYASDSLLGRITTKDVIIIESHNEGVSLNATTKAPSLNASKRTNYQKTKSIKYPITLQPGRVYFVKCGYLTQNLFDLPRQPTIRLLKPEEVRQYLRKRFLRKKIKAYLYDNWLEKTGLKTSLRKKQ